MKKHSRTILVFGLVLAAALYGCDDGGGGGGSSAHSWKTVGAAGFSAGEAVDISIVIDGSGVPYVAYSDAANDYYATVMKYSGGAWTAVGGAGFSGLEADDVSIALDGDGAPYVAYRQNALNVVVRMWDGDSWDAVGGNVSQGNADESVITIDSTGVVYVVYRDYVNDDKATAMMYDESAWSAAGSTAGFSADSADWISIALDSSGTLYVAYMDN
ncbi:MAG TPA: hypothetical protein PK573_13120, partial [Spirochaetota bacterium]|nr:hypothetical protein [Spirochaetota bacterium]